MKILDAEEGVSKADKPWKKQSFVIDTGAQYNPEICFQVFGEDRIEKIIEPLEEGMEVDVFFNLSSREYNDKYFHNVDAWKVETTAASTTATAPAPQIDDAPAEDDDLPF